MKKMFLRILLISTIAFLWTASAHAIPTSYGSATHSTTEWQELGQPNATGVSWSVNGGAWDTEQELYVGQTVQFKFDVHKKNLGTHYADFLKAWVDWDKNGTFEDSSETVAFDYQVLFPKKGEVSSSWQTDKTYTSSVFVLTNEHVGDFWLRARVACSESIWGGDWDGQWGQAPNYEKPDYETMFSATGHYHQGEVEEWALTVNPVPEPATMVLFGIGLLGLARVGRKRQ